MTMMMMTQPGQTPTPTTATSSGAFFPVVFFDGEREIDLGTIFITPSMNFKQFQSLLSQKIGISPHQITTYFTPFNHLQRRRHPVTNKFNFAAAIPESSSSFFFVVLKRSRRTRRRTRPKPPHAPDNFTLLRRGNDGNLNLNLNLPNLDLERYLISMNLNSDVYSDLSLYENDYYYNGGGGACGRSSDDGASSSGGGSSEVYFCDVCWGARMEGEAVPFHWCKNDAVTMVYRSPAGPIGPPNKNRVTRF